jgi:hypothetical protein
MWTSWVLSPSRKLVSRALETIGDGGYDGPMAKAKEFDFEKPVPVIHDEDQGTLASIDEGIRDAKAGRTTTLEQVRKLLPQSITESFSRRER